jgi:hypothetical protein
MRDAHHGFVEIPGSANTFGCDAHHALGAAAALGRGLAHPGADEALAFQALDGGVESANGALAARGGLNLFADGGAVGFVAEAAGSGDEQVFEFTEPD